MASTWVRSCGACLTLPQHHCIIWHSVLQYISGGTTVTPYHSMAPCHTASTAPPPPPTATHQPYLAHASSIPCSGNDYAQLGLGDTADRGLEPGDMGASLPPVDAELVVR